MTDRIVRTRNAFFIFVYWTETNKNTSQEKKNFRKFYTLTISKTVNNLRDYDAGLQDEIKSVRF